MLLQAAPCRLVLDLGDGLREYIAVGEFIRVASLALVFGPRRHARIVGNDGNVTVCLFFNVEGINVLFGNGKQVVLHGGCYLRLLMDQRDAFEPWNMRLVQYLQ